MPTPCHAPVSRPLRPRSHGLADKHLSVPAICHLSARRRGACTRPMNFTLCICTYFCLGFGFNFISGLVLSYTYSRGARGQSNAYSRPLLPSALPGCPCVLLCYAAR
ncbi:hypothetical protein BD311DRAFT_747376 [Dichomitus squalens]|uniref:Uncharacterized protein n=1 Tax=Dichomitus squalens TaxID=114155 RepID=A0A4V2K1V2_9APHY|nr:hypothetical protein BD311DRAFT_747376 [Dichomitus squalens]